MDYFRLDLPDWGILTIEKDLLGGFPDDPALVMAFGFPNGESSIWAERAYQFLTGGGSGGPARPPQSPPRDAGIEAVLRGT